MSNTDTSPAAIAPAAIAPAAIAPAASFSWDADVKPYLESQTVQGAFHAIAGSVLGIVFGASAASQADSVWQIIVSAGTLIGGGIGLYGSINALIGRLRATRRLV